ncbi:MAG: hypothetical protein ACPGGK_09760 [Pikeienuella sp.]
MDDHEKDNVTILIQPSQKQNVTEDLLAKLIDPAGLVFSKDFYQTTLCNKTERKSA